MNIERLKQELCPKCYRRFTEGYFYSVDPVVEREPPLAPPTDRTSLSVSVFDEMMAKLAKPAPLLYWLCPCEAIILVSVTLPYEGPEPGYRLILLGPHPASVNPERPSGLE